jgi:hypothetical protein
MSSGLTLHTTIEECLLVHQTTVISIFLASPSDVAPERRLVERAIQRWNAVRGRNLGCTLELLNWENSTSSAIGADGQDVVNQQIGDEYDAMIALFWSKIGLETPRAASGSIEEYERVLDRHKSGSDAEIGIYFKNANIPMSQIDPKQLQGIFDLKDRVENDGVYHKSFSDDDSLYFEIDLFLERIVAKFKGGFSKGAVVPRENRASSEDIAQSAAIAEDEEGYLDIVEALEKHSTATTEFLARTGENIERISEVVTKSAARFTELAELGNPNPSEVRKVIDEVAKVFDEFSGTIEGGIVDFDESTSGIANESIKLIRVSEDFDPDAEQIGKAREELEALYVNMTGAMQSMQEFGSTVRGLQRMTTAFNRAKKRVHDNINKMVSAISSSQTIIGQAIDLLKD